MGKLEGKVALVTGSGRNIGRATVLKFAGEGANVVVNARSNRQEAEAVAREARDLGVEAVPVDVGKKAEVEALAAKALSEFGRVDILINNAAIRPHKPFHRNHRRGLGVGPERGSRRRALPDARADRANGQESLRAHSVLRWGRRDFRSRQRPHAFISSQDGLIGMARGSPPNSRRITSGLMSFLRAASIRGETILSGIRVACQTLPVFPSRPRPAR
jgi:NAD(P)-dependent dehydrogenase (short-subunit alcohol dehydrogenase family)